MDKDQQRELTQRVKKDVKGHDQFVTAIDHSWARVAQHRGVLLGAVTLAAVVAGGVTLISYLGEKKESQAQTELFLAKHTMDEAMEEIKKRTAPAEKPAEKLTEKSKEKPSQKEAPPAEISLEERQKLMANAISKLETVVQDFSGTKASTVAAVDAAQAWMELNQAQKALDVLNRVPEKKAGSVVLEATLALVKAQTLERLGNWNGAISALDQIPSGDSTPKFIASEAIMVRAMVALKLNDLGKASELLKELGAKYPESRAGRASKALLRSVKGELVAKGS